MFNREKAIAHRKLWSYHLAGWQIRAELTDF